MLQITLLEDRDRDKVVEINAESPGGMQSVEHFSGIDFSLTICDALERRLEVIPQSMNEGSIGERFVSWPDARAPS